MTTFARIETRPGRASPCRADVYVGDDRVGTFYGRTFEFVLAAAERYADREYPTCTARSATLGLCGDPAVYAFVSRDGERFAECETHYFGVEAANGRHLRYDRSETYHRERGAT